MKFPPESRQNIILSPVSRHLSCSQVFNILNNVTVKILMKSFILVDTFLFILSKYVVVNLVVFPLHTWWYSFCFLCIYVWEHVFLHVTYKFYDLCFVFFFLMFRRRPFCGLSLQLKTIISTRVQLWPILRFQCWTAASRFTSLIGFYVLGVGNVIIKPCIFKNIFRVLDTNSYFNLKTSRDNLCLFSHTVILILQIRKSIAWVLQGLEAVCRASESQSPASSLPCSWSRRTCLPPAEPWRAPQLSALSGTWGAVRALWGPGPELRLQAPFISVVLGKSSGSACVPLEHRRQGGHYLPGGRQLDALADGRCTSSKSVKVETVVGASLNSYTW